MTEEERTELAKKQQQKYDDMMKNWDKKKIDIKEEGFESRGENLRARKGRSYAIIPRGKRTGKGWRGK